ncbi:hypothetical protein [Mesorhizobium sp. CAU 1741]|uniref:hypothetical protein n=1 Tax=Mesorhizobium sp. CAU 1741 TaxID=3140366 RepID=UPI00325BB332
MFERIFSPRRILLVTGALLLVLFAIGWATRQNPDDKPYIRIVGGGFIFNYRIADVHYGFTAVVQRPLPAGSIVEASFEDPSGGEAHIVRQRLTGAKSTRFAMRSPPVRGVEAGKPYHVALRVFDREEKSLLWSHEQDFRTQISDDVAPEVPLTVGPGYARNPETGG